MLIDNYATLEANMYNYGQRETIDTLTMYLQQCQTNIFFVKVLTNRKGMKYVGRNNFFETSVM